ncbi:MAG: hypothetical protein IKU52_07555 [Clostridia bacterium]|nr:hypothetical protein [Clostridia bacterium]
MKEREIIKNALAEFVPDKEKIRGNVTKNNKKIISMKKLVLVVAVISILCSSLLLIPLYSRNGKNQPPVIPESEAGENSINEALETEGYRDKVIGGGGYGVTSCSIHSYHYHNFEDNEVLMNYVGEDNYYQWKKDFYDESGYFIQDSELYEKHNLLEFIKVFNIPDEVVIEAYLWDYYDSRWNIELLLSKDEIAYAEYAKALKKGGGDYNRTSKRDVLLDYEKGLKLCIVNKIGKKEDKPSQQYYNKIKNKSVSLISIVELIDNSSVTLDDLESMVSIDRNFNNLKYSNYYCRPYKYIYNFDLLFDERVALDAQIETLEYERFVPKAVTIDSLLRVGENGVLAQEGKAVETDMGIYIPEGLLPQNDEDLEQTKDFIQYKGRIFWYTETVQSKEEIIANEIIVPKSHAYSWNDYYPDEFYGEPFDWSKHDIYDFTSTLSGDIYFLKDYSDRFRLFFCNYDKDPNSFMIFESNKGITLNKGEDLFGKETLNFENKAKAIYSSDKYYGKRRYNREATEKIGRIKSVLLSSVFILDTSDLSALDRAYVSIEMNDGSNVNLTVYENGYVEYEHISGYGVYLKLESYEIRDLLMQK